MTTKRPPDMEPATVAAMAAPVGASTADLARLRNLKACLFDAYGTLFDVFSVTALCEELFPGKDKFNITMRLDTAGTAYPRGMRYRDASTFWRKGCNHGDPILSLALAVGMSKPTNHATEEGSMTLEERLAAIREQSKARMPPEARAVLLRSIDDLRGTGIMQRVAQVGSRAPEFTLPNAAGQPVSLGELRARGPVVLSFYRGRW